MRLTPTRELSRTCKFCSGICVSYSSHSLPLLYLLPLFYVTKKPLSFTYLFHSHLFAFYLYVSLFYLLYMRHFSHLFIIFYLKRVCACKIEFFLFPFKNLIDRIIKTRRGITFYFYARFNLRILIMCFENISVSFLSYL